MLINFSYNTFFNIYLISPITSLHKIDYKKKIIITFLFLVLYHYYNYIFAIISIICNLYTIVNIPVSYNKLTKRLNFSSIYYLLIFNIILCINIIKSNINYNILSEFIIRIICLPVTSCLCLKVLFLTTKYELIVLFFLHLIQITATNITEKLFFIIIVSSQLILQINYKIYKIAISIKLRYMNKIMTIKYVNTYYSSIIYGILVFINTHKDEISSNLHTRKISYKKLKIIHF
uniref:hypothetical protein n=1 Tax=Caulacanthus ustulatus TaxID=31411 RepID=UPI0027DA11FA|nr:hypothetical protein REQ00_pgp115 [Caulacanthus ustulatus]WCH57310.1 hypothetical protein [Caulacanthus ustulatus]